MSFAVSHRYNPQLILIPSGNNKFFYTYSADYCLYRINPEGRPDLVIKKLEDYRPISQKEKDEVVQSIREQISGRGQTWPEGVIEQACQFPLHSPFFDRLIIDDAGRLYVRRIKSTLDKSESVEYDIFSSDGYYLYKSALSFSPDAIKNSHMYDISSDEETGEVKIKRYKINNWNDIKKGI